MNKRVRKTRWSFTSGSFRHFFDDILICASKTESKNLIRKLEPFHLQELVPYKNEYLSGFMAEKYSIGLEQGFSEAKSIIHSELTRMIRRRIVADEVRNLALRAADAAKNTADLIEGTVKKVKGGLDLVGRTEKDFAEVAQSTSKLAELIDEINAASNEQSQGIEQVNNAVHDMDKVTQRNAANAEESASASEEMNAQAEHMKNLVQNLVKVVGGSGRKKSIGLKKVTGRTGIRAPKPSAVAAPIAKEPAVQGAGAGAKEVQPEQVIPMDDGDFKDF